MSLTLPCVFMLQPGTGGTRILKVGEQMEGKRKCCGTKKFARNRARIASFSGWGPGVRRRAHGGATGGEALGNSEVLAYLSVKK